MTTPILFARGAASDATLVFGADAPESPTDLVFYQSPVTGASVALVFGEETGGGGGADGVTASIAVDLAATLEVAALCMPTVDVNVQHTLPATLTVQAGTYYDNRLTPWKAVYIKTQAQPAAPARAGAGDAWEVSSAKTVRFASLHTPATVVGATAQSGQDAAKPLAAARQAGYSLADVVTTRVALPAQAGVPVHGDAAARYAEATPVHAPLHGSLQTGVPRHCARTCDSQRAVPHSRRYGGTIGLGRSTNTGAALPWGLGRAPLPGGEVWPPAPPVTPPLIVGTALLFECPPLAAPFLVFGATCDAVMLPQSPLYILPARFYMAAHNVTAYLLPGLEPVPIFDLSLAADVDSTVWTFSASTPREYFDALAPTSGTPRQIKVVADAMEFVFLVDSLKQTESFGKRRASISGRSATALVGEPYSRATQRLSTTAQTAQQIATAALQYSGVGLDWGITDWLVASGAWSHTGTPLAAVQSIAQAAGGYVLSHRSQPTLLVRHPYPLLPGGIPSGPWNWEGAAGAFAADVELAPDVILSRSVERADGADVDGVYVAGTVAGSVEALVRRSGTVGAKLAAMQTDALITALEAAQQRGLATLGVAGPKHKVQITMPVLVGGANPGLLDVGQLVQINESAPWRGRVRAVQMQYTAPTLRQTVTLERHLA